MVNRYRIHCLLLLFLAFLSLCICNCTGNSVHKGDEKTVTSSMSEQDKKSGADHKSIHMPETGRVGTEALEAGKAKIPRGDFSKGKRIVIDKTKRKLFLYSGNRLLRSYPIVLGRDPSTDKERQGDGCTPEGRFYICTKNPKSKFYLSLGISYPNKEDAVRGLKEGIISRHEYDAIVYAIDHKRQPPWNTRLGGAICIHGGGTGWDWTLGCIALENKDVRDLFRLVPLGTPVVIIRSPQHLAVLRN